MSFHAPVHGRITDHPVLGSSAADGNNGAFVVPSPEPGWELWLICSDGEGWEHVSVQALRGRRLSRIPTWREMSLVKDRCWDDEDAVVQFHPPRSEYVSNHPHVLHLWRPIGEALLRPPAHLVGVLALEHD